MLCVCFLYTCYSLNCLEQALLSPYSSVCKYPCFFIQRKCQLKPLHSYFGDVWKEQVKELLIPSLLLCPLQNNLPHPLCPNTERYKRNAFFVLPLLLHMQLLDSLIPGVPCIFIPSNFKRRIAMEWRKKGIEELALTSHLAPNTFLQLCMVTMSFWSSLYSAKSSLQIIV